MCSVLAGPPVCAPQLGPRPTQLPAGPPMASLPSAMPRRMTCCMSSTQLCTLSTITSPIESRAAVAPASSGCWSCCTRPSWDTGVRAQPPPCLAWLWQQQHQQQQQQLAPAAVQHACACLRVGPSRLRLPARDPLPPSPPPSPLPAVQRGSGGGSACSARWRHARPAPCHRRSTVCTTGPRSSLRCAHSLPVAGAPGAELLRAPRWRPVATRHATAHSLQASTLRLPRLLTLSLCRSPTFNSSTRAPSTDGGVRLQWAGRRAGSPRRGSRATHVRLRSHGRRQPAPISALLKC